MNPKRNGWKIAFFFLLAALLGVSGTAAYLILDQAVSLTYLQEGYEDTEDNLRPAGPVEGRESALS